jgi:uncharacterized protein
MLGLIMTDQLAWVMLCFSLIFILEGLVPAINPKIWKNLLQKMLTFSDQKVRMVGVFSMIIGAVLMAIVHQLYRI